MRKRGTVNDSTPFTLQDTARIESFGPSCHASGAGLWKESLAGEAAGAGS